VSDATTNAQTVIEAALVEANRELEEAARDQENYLLKARFSGERCRDLRQAIAAYHKALGRNSDGSERKVRGAGEAEKTDE
jgi:hypothetical protein